MNQYHNLFLSQSYMDAYNEYTASLVRKDYPVWDYVVLTAANEAQAEIYRMQIEYRLSHGKLPASTVYLVVPDREGKRIGSGGATLGVLKEIARLHGSDHFTGLKLLVIHSGGDSKRIPQYSACGKLFSPVPRRLADGRRSTLFDEFIIGMTGIPARIRDGMLVLSGDVLLLFNPLQLDFYGKGAAAISFKKEVEIGQNHGVFVAGADGNVDKFLHKQSTEILRSEGAVDSLGNVDIDTGAILLSSELLDELAALIATDDGFDFYVNERARLSFYGDFVYPMAASATLDNYLMQAPEGSMTEELIGCRRKLWSILHGYSMRLLRFSPASFIHFGTTGELLSLLCNEMTSYGYLGWSNEVNSNRKADGYAVSGSYIANGAVIGKGSYIEDCYLGSNVTVGEGAIVSSIKILRGAVPPNCVLHGLKLKNGKFVARFYGVQDNPKLPFHFGSPINQPLWNAPLFPVCDSMQEAVDAVLSGQQAEHMISLEESFRQADARQILPYQDYLMNEINLFRIVEGIRGRIPTERIANEIRSDFRPKLAAMLEEWANKSDFSLRLRIYDTLAKLSENSNREKYTQKCYQTIHKEVLAGSFQNRLYRPSCRIIQEKVKISLPVRVNFGGGWSDTPPYCIENGGRVLNAQITLDGRRPIEATIRRQDKPLIRLSCADNGSSAEFDDLIKLTDLSDPSDPFLLQKASLIGCGILPDPSNRSEQTEISLTDMLCRMGGGFELTTHVINIPRGSGLGTSSILAGACTKAITQFFGIPMNDKEVFNTVLVVEQLMSTGGGWQDQVGGIAPGIKFIHTIPGVRQDIRISPVQISKETLQALNSRFCLIYTGQRRLARNLLRDVIGRYIGNVPEALNALEAIQKLAVLMRYELEQGNIDRFAALMNEHWAISKQLDAGCTNTCIEQILLSCDDLIDGRMICGAGGGGFLQVILKKGVTSDDLQKRLFSVFADSGVRIQKCEFTCD